jgi:hypothetical protein
MPLGYIVPAAMTDVIELLQLHGVEMERLAKPMEQEFETYRLTNVKFDTRVQEGHLAVNFDAKPVTQKMTVPVNAWWIPMKQRLSRLIMAMLEPQAPDSLAYWGLMPSVFATGFREGIGDYLSEPIARRMMADNPELRKQFEAKLAADSQFAADGRARLQWWYQQSKYEPADTGVYPILRAWTAIR